MGEPLNPETGTAAQTELAAILVRLGEVEAALKVHVASRADATAASSAAAVLLQTAEARLLLSQAAQREGLLTQVGILNAIPAHLALLDANGVILEVNETWKRFASANVLQSPNFAIGSNYLEVCERASGECSEESAQVAAGLRRVLEGELPEFSLEYPCHSPTEQRWFRLMVTPVSPSRRAGVVVMHVNVTARRLAELALATKSEILATVTQSLGAYVERGDWSEALRGLLRCALEQTQSEYGFIGVVVGDSTLRVLAHEGMVWDKVLNREVYERALRQYREIGYFEFDNLDNLFGRPVTTGRVVMVNLPDGDPRSGGRPPGHPPMHCFLGVPISAGKKVRGVVALANRPGGYTDEDRSRIETLVQHAGGLCTSYLEHLTAVTLQEESRKAEGALRTSEKVTRQLARNLEAEHARLVAAQAVAKVGSWETDLTTLAVLWSAETYRIFETDPADFTPTLAAFLERVHPDDREKLDEAFRQSLGSREGREIVHRLLLPDGRTKFIEERWQVSFDAENKPVRATGTAQDITERTLAEQRMAVAQHFNATLIESSPLAIVAYKASGEGVMANVAAMKILGAPSVEAVRTQNFRDILVWQGTGLLASADEALAAREPREREIRTTNSFGKEIWLHCRLIPLSYAGEAYLFGFFDDIRERKRAEEELLRTQALARMAGRLARIGAWSVDLRDMRSFWSDEVCAIHGVPPGYRTTVEQGIAFYAPEFRPTIAEEFGRCANEGRSFDLELQIVNLGGQRVSARVMGEAVRDETGKIVGVQGALQDITERKTQEGAQRESAEALRASEERFRLLAKATNDAIWDWDLATDALWWNEGFEILFGFRRDEIEPTVESWTNRVHPSDRNAVVADVKAAIARGDDVWSGEYRFQRKDGGYAYVLDRGHIIRDGQGKAVRMIGGMTDLTERKRAEVKLQASESRYRLLFASNPLPMWIFDLETLRFLAVNQAAVEHYGYSEAEFLSMDVFAIRPPEEAARLEEHLRTRAGRGHTGKESGRWRHRKKDGSIIDVEITSDNLESEGRTVRLVLANDVTERVRAEQEVARANRALRMLSHCNEAMIRVGSEAALLTEICTSTTEIGGFRMAWVGYAADDAAKSIVPKAHAGVEDGYLSLLKLSWAEDHATGRGPSARAIRSGIPVVVSDVTDPRVGSRWVEEARARGYYGQIALPLKDEVRSFGVLVLYTGECREVLPDELTVLKELADNLAFGVLSLRARAERRRTHDAVLTMARGISTATGEEFFEKLTHNMVEALGAHGGAIARFGPAPGRARTIAVVVDGRTSPNFEYALAGRPCGALPPTEPLIVPRDVRRLYPEARSMIEAGIEGYVGTHLLNAAHVPIGLLFVEFRQPLEHPDFVASTLKIFASRAAAELERQDVDARTREQAALIDQARDGIIVRDLEHRVMFWSKGAERLYGWTAAEALGKKVQEYLKVDLARFSEAHRVVVETGEWIGETQKTTKARKVLTLDARWTLLHDTQGRPKSILSIDTDVTERKLLETQFLRAQRMESIGTLAGGIAHDLNNLLAPITMGVELLRQFGPSPQSVPVIDYMQQSAKRGADLVKQVLSFARGVEGTRVAIQPGHIVREVQSIAEKTFPKNITIESEIAAGLWLIMADPTQLNQVLLNLCVNARDAMPDGGRLEIRAENIEIDAQFAAMISGMAPGRYVVIQVVDEGSGMPPAVVERIFEPFFTTKELGKGTGLGLSTVLGIVRSHGGFVNVYSEVGKGSTFKVYLPAQPEGVDAPVAPVGEEKLPRGNGELIMVVDDEPSIIAITQQTLETFGYKVVTAEDGAQAIGLYALHRDEIQVVLTDMMMPVMDGPVLIAALRRINPRVRVIAASGLTANANLARATHAGVTHFLAKPYPADALLGMLKSILAEKPGSSGSRPPM